MKYLNSNRLNINAMQLPSLFFTIFILLVACNNNVNNQSICILEGNGDYSIDAFFSDDGFAMIINVNDQCGLVDYNGRIIVPCEYEFIDPDYHEGITKAKINGEWLFLNMNGDQISNERFKKVGDFHEGIAAVIKKCCNPWGKMSYITVDGKVLAEVDYDGNPIENARFVNPRFVNPPLRPCKEGFVIEMYDNCKYNYRNVATRQRIPNYFDYAFPFSEGLAVVCISGKWGIIDHGGKFVIDPQYDFIQDGFIDDIAIIAINDKYGAIRRNGSILIPPIYDEISPPSDGVCRARNLGLYGFIDIKSGKELIPCSYNDATSFMHGVAVVYSKEKDETKIINKNNSNAFPELNIKSVYFPSQDLTYLFFATIQSSGTIETCIIDYNGNIVMKLPRAVKPTVYPRIRLGFLPSEFNSSIPPPPPKN